MIESNIIHAAPGTTNKLLFLDTRSNRKFELANADAESELLCRGTLELDRVYFYAIAKNRFDQTAR